ncbi:FeoA family protein [Pannus brasiliensis CCIBt3594]|uniref:FeoA family protein n=1 Tax=Pannus brasiliensis CCIBt3594 TaxID=1427578 RepID=A0AAW9R074_9CHRO
MISVFSHGKTSIQNNPAWKFAYIGGTAGERNPDTISTLREMRVGDRVRVEGYDDRDLQKSGLSVGAEIRVLSRTPSGSVMVQLGERQIGIGAGIIDRIFVKPL